MKRLPVKPKARAKQPRALIGPLALDGVEVGGMPRTQMKQLRRALAQVVAPGRGARQCLTAVLATSGVKGLDPEI